MEIEIQELKKSIDKIIEVNKDQMIRLDEISGNMLKQEIILARIENVEDRVSDEVKTLNKRIDEECHKVEGEPEMDVLQDITNVVIVITLVILVVFEVTKNVKF